MPDYEMCEYEVANATKLTILVAGITLKPYQIASIQVNAEQEHEILRLCKTGQLKVKKSAPVLSSDDYFELLPGLMKAAGQKRGDRE